MAEFNDKFNSLIRTSLAECGNDYEKYLSTVLAARVRIHKNMKNTTITDVFLLEICL